MIIEDRLGGVPDVVYGGSGGDRISTGATRKTNTGKKNRGGSAENAAHVNAQFSAPNSNSFTPTELISWGGAGGIEFFVRPGVIQGIKEITIKASANTEDKEGDGEQYVGLKSEGGYTITLTGLLSAHLGCDVEGVANAILDAARAGESGYFYIGGKKLFPPQFMMTDAETKNILFTRRGDWISCEVIMTLKQCTKLDGTLAAETAASSGGGGGSGKGNGKKESWWDKVAKTATGKIQTVNDTLSQIKTALGAVNSAKRQSQKVLANSKR